METEAFRRDNEPRRLREATCLEVQRESQIGSYPHAGRLDSCTGRQHSTLDITY